MLRKMIMAAFGAAALALVSAGSASAALVYVGSWRIIDGPVDFTPLSAQSVAAMLFGGAAADYVVSKDFSDPTSREAWYLTNATIPATIVVAPDDVDPTYTPLSAYWAGDEFTVGADPDVTTNYAWRQVDDGALPEPSTWALLIFGFGATGSILRRRHATA